MVGDFWTPKHALAALGVLGVCFVFSVAMNASLLAVCRAAIDKGRSSSWAILPVAVWASVGVVVFGVGLDLHLRMLALLPALLIATASYGLSVAAVNRLKSKLA